MYDIAEILPMREYPICAVCKMPVLFFGMELWKDTVMFVAVCHGQVEFVPFTLEEFEGLTELEFEPVFSGSLTRPTGSIPIGE